MGRRAVKRRRNGFTRVQSVLTYAASHLDADLSLAALGERVHLSPSHLHRLFAAVAGETTKAFTSRLRLERAAAMLLTGDSPVLGVALKCGFRSHEAFSRLFRQRFGMAPSMYRRRGLLEGQRGNRANERAWHAHLVAEIGPCLKLYHAAESTPSESPNMTYSIAVRTLSPQPVLVMRRRVRRSEVAKALGELLGAVFLHAQRCGAALAGQPFTRYLEWGPGVLSIEAGLPIAAPVPGEGPVLAATLPGGSAAVTTHAGGYEGLSDAHAAVQAWIEANGYRAAGAPWEVYVTDPADFPDAKDWRTDVYWPIAS